MVSIRFIFRLIQVQKVKMSKIKDNMLAALCSQFFYVFYFLCIFIEPHIKFFIENFCYFGIFSRSTCSIIEVPQYEGSYDLGMFSLLVLVLMFFVFVLIEAKIKSKKNISVWKIRRRGILLFILPFFTYVLHSSVINFTIPFFDRSLIKGSSVDCCLGELHSTSGKKIQIDKGQVFCANRKNMTDANVCTFKIPEFSR